MIEARTNGQVRRSGHPAPVNGPEDAALPWRSIDWPRMMAVVQRLRQRIFTASQKGNWKQVRNLQKLMLRSYANAVLSVRRVTELNAGKSTPGVDGRIIVAKLGSPGSFIPSAPPSTRNRSAGCLFRRPTASVAP